jgi:hypothetical protein
MATEEVKQPVQSTQPVENEPVAAEAIHQPLQVAAANNLDIPAFLRRMPRPGN